MAETDGLSIMAVALEFLIAATLWAIIDMDHPHNGLIRVGQQPMLDLLRNQEMSPSA